MVPAADGAKEVEGKIGETGSYSLDVQPTGLVRIEVGGADSGSGVKGGAFVEVPLVAILEAAAKKTDNKVDDAIVALVKSAFTVAG